MEMKRMELEDVLRDLGFSEYKIKAYLTLVRLKRGSVGDIAKHSGVPTSKLYEVLRGLHETGFITEVSQKPLVFRANDPKSVLKGEIRSKKDSLERIENELDKLSMAFPVAEKDIIQITSTRDAYFKKIKESVSNAKNSIDYLAKHWRLDADLIRLLNKKSDRGVRIRALGPINKEMEPEVRLLRDAGVRIKNFEPEETHFAIYDKSMVVISLRSGEKKSDYSAIWIKSEVLAKILGAYFNILWADAA